MLYEYRFTGTMNDLLDANEAELSTRFGSGILRVPIVVLGISFVAMGLYFFILSGEGNPPWSIPPMLVGLVPIVFGLLMIYFFGVFGYLNKRKLGRQKISSQEVVLTFQEEYLEVQTLEGASRRTYNRKWNEMVRFINSPKGILFYFQGDIAHWLPGRVFSDKAEREQLLAFLKERKLTPPVQ